MSLIPRVLLMVSEEDFNIHWDCPGCGEHNVIFLPDCFSVANVKREVQGMADQLEKVKCSACCRQFERAEPNE